MADDQVVEFLSERQPGMECEEIGLRQELEAIRRAKGAQDRMLASVLHDIRSPLNVILLASQVVCDPEARQERRQRNAQLLQDAATAINTLCQDVLDFSKLQAGQMELSLQSFNLRDCIGNITDGLRMVAAKKGIELRAFVAPQCPTQVVGDPGRLRQVLVNLLSNAIKFTYQGQVDVTITCGPIESGETSLFFDVHDTGLGIHEEKLQNLFEAFSQAHGDLSNQLGGCGLGLAIARQLVLRMGGGVRVSSLPGRGTSFEFHVRVGVTEAEREPLDLSLKALRVLILDEVVETQTDLQSACISLGMHPVVTADGGEAVRLLLESADKGCPFPFAIVNLESGGGDALFIVEQIHPDKRKLTHFLAYTLQGQRGDSVRCQEAEVQGYLTGAVEKQILEDLMRDLLTQPGPERFVTRHSSRPSPVPENA
ncbi:hypothetical protein IV102_34745 [bacterium]|nr:hypothetical protein [bacterium]